jgi:hypothetical protein
VEDRLFKKGEEYRYNKAHIKHTLMQQLITETPPFKPQLVSNNDKYLAKRKEEEEGRKQGDHLYFDAVVSMVTKHTKIAEAEDKEKHKERIPDISKQSRKIADKLQE